MKKSNFIIATLLVAVAASVAFVSCKKESQDALLNNNQPVKAFTVPQVNDMNAYLKEFKQKMQESQNSKDVEYLSLEEAAWHLSSVANFDYGEVNVRYTDLRYDTLNYQVCVTNGQVALSELNTLYAIIASDIEALFQNLDLQEKHFRLIGVCITDDGQVVVDLIISYYILDHTWYFEDDFNAAMACYEWFESHVNYCWNTTATELLETAINFFEGIDYVSPGETPTEREYYIPTSDEFFNHEDYIDTLGSPFYNNSRIFVVRSNSWTVPYLDINEMCYCLDSYLALPFEFLQDNHFTMSTRPVHWTIIPNEYYNTHDQKYYFCHQVKVKFGIRVSTGGHND